MINSFATRQDAAAAIRARESAVVLEKNIIRHEEPENYTAAGKLLAVNRMISPYLYLSFHGDVLLHHCL